MKRTVIGLGRLPNRNTGFTRVSTAVLLRPTTVVEPSWSLWRKAPPANFRGPRGIWRRWYTAAAITGSSETQLPPHTRKRALPTFCPGCGAPSQLIAPADAGYYSGSRRAVRSYLNHDLEPKITQEQGLFNSAIESANPEALRQLGIDPAKRGMSAAAEWESC